MSQEEQNAKNVAEVNEMIAEGLDLVEVLPSKITNIQENDPERAKSLLEWFEQCRVKMQSVKEFAEERGFVTPGQMQMIDKQVVGLRKWNR